MASIQKRVNKDGSVSYRVQVRLRGHTPHTETFATKKEALAWATRTENNLKDGRHVPINEARRRTVGECIDRYLTDALPLKPRAKDKRNLEQRLAWWRQQIGGLSLAALTPSVISDYKSKLSTQRNRNGEPLAGGTVNRYLAALSCVLSVAVTEWNWLERSPIEGVSRRQENAGRVRFLSDDEREALLTACKESRCRALYPVVVLALSTGMRRGEIFGLTWADVDFKRRVIVLRTTKNGDVRAVPLVGIAASALAQWRKVQRLDSALVFPSRDPNRPLNLRASWEAALSKADIENFLFHDLRHSAASYLAMNGATPTELAAVLGHRTLAMVKRYAHLSDQHIADVVERMNQRIFK